MKRSLSGLLPLAMVMALGSCSGDPTSDLQDLVRIDATPTAMIINVGSAETIDLQLIDAQGSPRAGNLSFTIGNPAVVSVEVDTTYRPGLGSEALTRRYVIAALAADTTSVIFSGSGLTRRIGILANPLNFPAAFTGAPANVNDLVSFTAAGFKFPPGTRVTFGGNEQLVTSISADSNTMTFRAGNLGFGPVTVIGLTLASVTSTALSLPSLTDITVGPNVTPLAGTDAPATAPTILIPPGTGVHVVEDVGPFPGADITGDGGIGARYYTFTTTETRTFDVLLDWNSTADLDYVLCADVACAAADFTGATGAKPENHTYTDLAAGTYYLAVVHWAGTAPTTATMTITGH
jgi:hypothetical protein